MLVYKLLGDDAQSSFARSWGVSYGVGAAAEWKVRFAMKRLRMHRSAAHTRAHCFAKQQDVAQEAAKGLIILAILERLYLTRPVSWLEARASLQHKVCVHPF
jgi:hypothetical protein